MLKNILRRRSSIFPSKDGKSVIGPSTGWLSAKIGPEFSIQERVVSQTRATAVELVWTPGFRARALALKSIHSNVDYRSLHLSSFNSYLDPPSYEQQRLIDDLVLIFRKYHFHNATAHPDVMPPHIYRILDSANVLVSIENMDRNKAVGRTSDSIRRLMNQYDTARGVLDLQHAYELSSDTGQDYIELVISMAEILMKHQGLAQIHLSGERCEGSVQIEGHAQLNRATNTEPVLEVLRYLLKKFRKPWPIILEGDPLPDYAVLDTEDSLLGEELEGAIFVAAARVQEEIEFLDEALPGMLRLSA